MKDPVAGEHELDEETSSLAEQELSRLLGEGEADFGTTTVRLDAEELDELLVKARRQLPAPRSQLTTQPYDPITASALLDKDIEALDPEGKSDAELQAEALLELDDAAPTPDPAAVKASLEAAKARADAAKASAKAAVKASAKAAVKASAKAAVKASAKAAVKASEDDDATPTENADEVESSESESEDAAVAPAVATPTVVAPDREREPVSASIPPAGPAPASPATSTPLSPAAQAGAARTSLPSAGVEWPGARERKRRAMTFLAVGGALAAALALYFALAEAEAPAPASQPAPLAETTALAPAVPSQVQSAAEVDARKALDQLREGIGDCVRHAIGTLPGSSPAVPTTLKLASGAGYTAPAADWKTAVWSCAKFKLDAPMRFQLQWQSVKPGTEALGIAWIDDNGDGDPDRALGFRATAKGTRDVDLGEIAPMEVRPVLPVR
jgi:hypothetical protein